MGYIIKVDEDLGIELRAKSIVFSVDKSENESYLGVPDQFGHGHTEIAYPMLVRILTAMRTNEDFLQNRPNILTNEILGLVSSKLKDVNHG